MKAIILSLILTCLATPVFAASVVLPVQATIVNLTTMPIEQAVAFCDERNMACPSIREKYDSEYAHDDARQNIGAEFGGAERGGAMRFNEGGTYIE